MATPMTPDEYYELFVLENYEDFKNNKGSLRHAFNAAVSLTHMADHYYKYNKNHNKSKIKQFIKGGQYYNEFHTKNMKCLTVLQIYISKQTDDAFNVVRGISNAYKHLYNADDKHSDVSSAGSIEIISFPTKGKSDIVSELHGGKTICFTRKSSNEIEEVFPVIEKVEGFWKTFIHQ